MDRIYPNNEDVGKLMIWGENWTVYIFPKMGKRARKGCFCAVVNEFWDAKVKTFISEQVVHR